MGFLSDKSEFHSSVSFLHQEDVINTQCGYDARQKPVSGNSSCRLARRVLEELLNLLSDAVLSSSLLKEVDQQIVIYTKGCVPQFEKWLQDNLTIVAGIFIGIALLQVRWMSQGNDALGERSPGQELCLFTIISQFLRHIGGLGRRPQLYLVCILLKL